jgi:hypothetical protein
MDTQQQTKQLKPEKNESFCKGLTDMEEIFALSLLSLQHGLAIIRQPQGYEIFQLRR